MLSTDNSCFSLFPGRWVGEKCWTFIIFLYPQYDVFSRVAMEGKLWMSPLFPMKGEGAMDTNEWSSFKQLLPVESGSSLFAYRWRAVLWWYANDLYIKKTCLFKYIENFNTKSGKFSNKNSDISHISAQNIDCGYSLELPCWGSSKEYLAEAVLRSTHNLYFWAEIRKIMYTLVNPSFTI